MSNQALVTVVIPNYNHELYLKERIESVLNQSFQDFELYILDDCSTDDSLRVINTYKFNPKVKGIIVNNKNTGSLFKQWIEGINLANGKYLWIAESDDYADVDFLKETVKIAEQDDAIGFVFTDTVMVNQSREFLEKASVSNKKLSKFKGEEVHRITDRSKVLDYFVSDLIIWNASSVLFRRSAIVEVDFKFLSSLINAGDLFTYLSIALQYDMVYVNQPLNYFRKHEENTTKKNAMSGELFSDRQTIITYFIKELQQFQGSKTHLKSFFRRNFLTAVDFKLYHNVITLLKAYCRFKLITYQTYLILSFYVYYTRLFKVPNKYRMYIKKVLAK